MGAELKADRYHAGARVASLLLWIAALIVAFLALRVVANAIFGPVTGLGTLLLIAAALALAQPIAWLGEKQIVARWPSGRAARLLPGALEWRDQGTTTRLDLGSRVNFWRWSFVVANRRAGRVPNGHYCLALRLIEADTAVSFYAFFPPAAAETLTARYTFYQLRRGESPDQPELGGRSAIFRAAETDRWEHGAELDPADFEALLDHLARHLPDFAREPASAG